MTDEEKQKYQKYKKNYCEAKKQQHKITDIFLKLTTKNMKIL